MRLIDADSLKEKMAATLEVLKGIFPPGEQEIHIIAAFDTVRQMADDCHTIEAVPVVHGEWVLDLRGNWACSVCGNDPYHYNMENMNYCPNCGAKMDGGGNDGE